MKHRPVLLGVVFSALALALPVRAESPGKINERTLIVQGQGKVSAIPDVAKLSVEVNRDGPDLDPILAEVRRQMKDVLTVIAKQGIHDKDVRTDLFQVRPKFERDRRGNPQRAGYVVSNRLTVKVRELKNTGKVLAAVLNAGASTVDGPHFEIDRPELIEREVLAAATRDAQAKAQTIAEAAGVRLGDILAIAPHAVIWPPPRRPMARQAMASSAVVEAEEPIAVGEQTMAATVSMTFAIR